MSKLKALDPFAYPTATPTAILNGHKQRRVYELTPLNCSVRTHGLLSAPKRSIQSPTAISPSPLRSPPATRSPRQPRQTAL